MMQKEENDSDENSCVFERQTAEYSDQTSQFSSENDNYTKQFARLYLKRIEELSSILKKKLLAKWGSDANLIPLSELGDQNGRRCAIIGTLYKYQKYKPSILQDLSDKCQLSAPEVKEDYCSEDDQLFLEDQTSRIKLTGSQVNVRESVTGVVCAVIGTENKKSTFEVEDWCFCGCPIQSSVSSNSTSSGKLVFISGLEFASNPPNSALSLFIDWLGGLLGNEKVQRDQASVVRLVIAGNSIKNFSHHHASTGHASGKAEDTATAEEVSNGVKRFDKFLETVGINCYITVLPGEFDITALMMPQRAMQPGLFPGARKLNTVSGVTNPWIGKVSNRIITGTSGQPIQNIQKVCGKDTLEPIEWLERSLEWRHLCPTAPDTVPCLPFYKSDPFILKECPDIYFSGNMEKFQTRLYEGKEGQKVCLLCIPKFSATQTAVVVDLETLDARPISFGFH
ncbi:PREDICTED: DNA polymerase delta small subunit-like [Ceratosolen solmsi marchali]|uniref:DNA polymerase delta small subunit-like n=1 Tax=Ceratosolen solmsi marchali TaxID=326594 RepID=A0AAJ6YLX4_9HYME|nr:PREDICTED: DNA polymerase delta small subunit-like [Ceratosolen solmsi marchali]